MIPDLQDVLELPEWHYKSPAILAMTNMDLINKENFYWKRAIVLIKHYGLTDAVVEPFVNSVMHEDGHYIVVKSPYTRQQIQNLLLPSFPETLRNAESVAFQHPSTGSQQISSSDH
ncbi:hypothetical protein G6F43_014049 [Rhizopus delemar]|nr:hypothetical protein G6F43_014049 [Rhizopus delemar]